MTPEFKPTLIDRIDPSYKRITPVKPFSLKEVSIKNDDRNLILGIEGTVEDGRGVLWKVNHSGFVSEMHNFLKLPEELKGIYVFRTKYYSYVNVLAESLDQARAFVESKRFSIESFQQLYVKTEDNR